MEALAFFHDLTHEQIAHPDGPAARDGQEPHPPDPGPPAEPTGGGRRSLAATHALALLALGEPPRRTPTPRTSGHRRAASATRSRRWARIVLTVRSDPEADAVLAAGRRCSLSRATAARGAGTRSPLQTGVLAVAPRARARGRPGRRPLPLPARALRSSQPAGVLRAAGPGGRPHARPRMLVLAVAAALVVGAAAGLVA